jgi:ribosomal protein S27AE
MLKYHKITQNYKLAVNCGAAAYRGKEGSECGRGVAMADKSRALVLYAAGHVALLAPALATSESHLDAFASRASCGPQGSISSRI